MKFTTREIIICGIFAALICILAQISIPIPFTTVPLTLLIFAVAVTSIMLGAKCGLLSTIIYLILGSIGLPVFAQFSGGVGVLFGPTGGFLLGLPVMAFLIGFVKEKCNSNVLTFIAMILGLSFVYLTGTLMFSASTGSSIYQSLVACVIPFVLVDLLKLVLANVIGVSVCKRVYSTIHPIN